MHVTQAEALRSPVYDRKTTVDPDQRSMPNRRPSDGSVNSNDRLEPKLLRAAEANSVDGVREVVQDAQKDGRISDRFLAAGLLRSCEKGSIDVARFLLAQGAKTDLVIGNRLPPLLRAIEYGHLEVADLLIQHGANLEAADKKGRTALMTAAWKNRLQTLRLLLDSGANINATDSKKRNVMHNLAADKICAWSDDIISTLLKSNVQTTAQDDVGRLPLHWACASGKTLLAERLLKHRSASVSAEDKRLRTSLHFAATNDKLDTVELLLLYGANVNARSDGGWSALHNACEKGSVELVERLLQAGAELNGRLLKGMTPLHVAAESGNTGVVRRLLQHSDLKRTVKDGFGNTPLLRAAQLGKKDIVDLLAPWNNVEAMSSDAIGACNGFTSTIVDFGNFHNENKVVRKTVYELLYGRDPQDASKHAVSTLPKNIKATNFRWIHLPANNIAWCDALLTKRFIEEGASDVEGFKALERSFTNQHRGRQLHSHYMRPMCQVIPRAVPEGDIARAPSKPETPAIVINGPVKITTKDITVPSTPEQRGKTRPEADAGLGAIPFESGSATAPKARQQDQAANGSRSPKNTPKKGKDLSGKKQDGTANEDPAPRDTPKKSKHQPVKQPRKNRTEKTAASPSPAKRNLDSAASSNIYMFTPYLHFETYKRRQEMQKAIQHVEKSAYPHVLTRSETFDEMLIRAHLTASSSVLHIRRTLDQFFYHNIDTRIRDRDQVVYRYQKRNRNPGDPVLDPKIFMVDQLWMWILGKDLIVTSFPQRWQQPRNDPINVLEGIIEDINSKTREPVQNVYELAMMISGRCFGTFDRHRSGDSEYQFLDMFESSIGRAMDDETRLFQEFSGASQQASAWLQHHQRPTRISRNLEATSRTQEAAAAREAAEYEDLDYEPLFVDKLLDIGQETDLLAEIKDIREELYMIRMVIEHQQQVLPEMKKALVGIYQDERSEKQVRKVESGYEEQEKIINMPLKDIGRMDKQAERIYDSITDLLDLKQKHANAFEARFARDQAAGTARQGQTIMVFTIVTVIFLPLTFIAAFFTIELTDFPHDSHGNPALSLSYVSKYIFGIGIAIAIPCIFVALSVDELGYFFGTLRRKLRLWWFKRRGDSELESEKRLQTLAMEHSFSVAKSMRRSVEFGWHEKAISPVTRRTTDIERDGRRWNFEGVGLACL